MMADLFERTQALVTQQRLKRQEAGTDWDHEFEVRAALLLNLAASLDKGAGLAQAAVSKEFRSAMAEIMKDDTNDSDGWDDWASGLGTAPGVTGISSLGNPS